MSVKSNPTGATVVLVDGGGEAEAAGEEARGGVDAHDLRDDGIERISIDAKYAGREAAVSILLHGFFSLFQSILRW